MQSVAQPGAGPLEWAVGAGAEATSSRSSGRHRALDAGKGGPHQPTVWLSR